MIFHLEETSAQSSMARFSCGSNRTSLALHAVVEVMFVATKLEYQKNKFFIQLMRLFIREVGAVQGS